MSFYPHTNKFIDKFYYYQCRWEFRKEKDGFCFGDFTKQQGIEYIAGMRAYDCTLYWAALKKLSRFNFKKNEAYGAYCKINWFLCIFAMLLNRKQKGYDFPSYENDNVLCIDSRDTYGGWEGEFLDFHRKTFTYCIYSDGDCSL